MRPQAALRAQPGYSQDRTTHVWGCTGQDALGAVPPLAMHRLVAIQRRPLDRRRSPVAKWHRDGQGCVDRITRDVETGCCRPLVVRNQLFYQAGLHRRYQLELRERRNVSAFLQHDLSDRRCSRALSQRPAFHRRATSAETDAAQAGGCSPKARSRTSPASRHRSSRQGGATSCTPEGTPASSPEQTDSAGRPSSGIPI